MNRIGKQGDGKVPAAGRIPAAGEAVLFLLYGACALCCAFFRILVNTDELWNFAFGENMAWGLLPYRDFNYLQTPFSALVNSLAFRLLGGHILVMRLLGAVLFTAMAIVLYKNSRILGAGRLAGAVPGFVLILVFSSNIFFEYAGLCLFLLLVLMGTDLRLEGEKSGLQLLMGILGGLAALSKQTYGTFIAAASWISIFIVTVGRGGGLKKAGELTLRRMLGSALPCFAFLFYLLGTGTFDDFWDMCVLGIGTFSARYRYWSMMLENPGYFLAGLALPALIAGGAIFALIRWRQWRRQEGLFRDGDSKDMDVCRRQGLQMTVILVYTVCGCINMVPLANLYHFETCAMPAMLIAQFLLAAFLSDRNRRALGSAHEGMPEGEMAAEPAGKRKKCRLTGQRAVQAVSAAGIAAILVFLLICNPVIIARDFRLHTDIPRFEYTYISEELSEEIRQVSAFIEKEQEKGGRVYVLDNCAGYYLRPLGIYHKYLDMFLLGNLGLKSPEECLEETLAPKTVYLLGDETRENTQFPRKEAQAFCQKLQADGKLGSYEIYRVPGGGERTPDPLQGLDPGE